MADTPTFSIFSSVAFPVLKTSDVTSGLSRAAYEKVRGRSSMHAVSEGVTQTIGSMIGRAVDLNDDGFGTKIGTTALEGQVPVVKSIATGMATYGIDYAMGRTSAMAERIGAPIALDFASGYVNDWIVTTDQRIL